MTTDSAVWSLMSGSGKVGEAGEETSNGGREASVGEAGEKTSEGATPDLSAARDPNTADPSDARTNHPATLGQSTRQCPVG
jgi:hypothetical protein